MRTERRKISNQVMKNYRKIATYKTIHFEYPQLTYLLLNDLLKLEGFSETEISFASGIRLDIVRKIQQGDRKKITTDVFFNLLGLYARVFCNWFNYPDPL